MSRRVFCSLLFMGWGIRGGGSSGGGGASGGGGGASRFTGNIHILDCQVFNVYCLLLSGRSSTCFLTTVSLS